MKSLVAFCAAALSLLSGCASVKMQETALVQAPKQNMAIVNFVRTRIFFGDGLPVDIWDGQTYVGSLGAGNIIQYEATPGKHLFLGNSENWSYATADLQAGKQYFIKANLFPGVLYGRVALAEAKPDDARIKDWLTNTPVAVSEADRKAVGDKKREKVQAAVADFEAGKVTSFAKVEQADGR